MVQSRSILSGTVLVLMALGLAAPRPAASAREGDVALVVQQDVPVDNLSQSDLRRVMLGDRQFWGSSLRVTILIRNPGTHERDVVLRRIYGMNDAQFRQYWIAKVFRAEAVNSPKTVNSNSATLALVAGLPGAIGFVEAGQVPRGVKIVKIDGHLPGDPGYLLR